MGQSQPATRSLFPSLAIRLFPTPSITLLDRLSKALHARHYSRRTEQAYCHWVKRFIFLFHNVCHPGEMAEPEINAFLTHLAVKE
jgi:hypothetical protein